MQKLNCDILRNFLNNVEASQAVKVSSKRFFPFNSFLPACFATTIVANKGQYECEQKCGSANDGDIQPSTLEMTSTKGHPLSNERQVGHVHRDRGKVAEVRNYRAS